MKKSCEEFGIKRRPNAEEMTKLGTVVQQTKFAFNFPVTREK